MTQPSDRVRVGVVGASTSYGWGMRAHLPALLGLPEYELAAVATSHRETAEASRDRYGATKAYWDYNDLVTDPDVEVVDVCVRAPTHYEVAIAALRAGKHLFCEWPLGANTDQAEEMATLAAEQGVHTMVGLQARYAPSFQHLRNLIADGYVGRPISANVTMFLPGLTRPRREGFTWSADRSQGAHTLSIATGHALDVFLWCVGELQDVGAMVETQVPQWQLADSEQTIAVSSPDNVLFTGRLANGALASGHIASVPWHGTAFRMEVYGDEGTLIASSDQMVEMVDPILRGGKGNGSSMEVMAPPSELNWTPSEVPAGVAVNMAQMFRRFAQAVRGMEVDAHPDFTEALRRHRTLDALARSSDTNQRVTL